MATNEVKEADDGVLELDPRFKGAKIPLSETRDTMVGWLELRVCGGSSWSRFGPGGLIPRWT